MDQIKYILDNFEFDKVWQAMRAVGWKWGPEDSRHCPTFTELRRTAKMLLEDAAKKQARYSTGGFEAIYADGILELNFVLASASTEDYDEQ